MIDAKTYPVEIRPLSAEDGGGWLATFPDLPGCMGDGETPAAAIEDGYAAAKSWLQVATACGDAIPAPSSGSTTDQEGVSMNTRRLALIAQGIEARSP